MKAVLQEGDCCLKDFHCERLFWEYMLESAENCMLSVWQLSCFTFPLFRKNPSEEYFCNERIVRRQRAACCLGREGAVGVVRERPQSCTSCISKLGVRFSEVIFLLPPGFKVGRGDSSGYEGPPAVLQPWWCPGEQVGSALWPQPPRSHSVSQWAGAANWAQRSLW